MATYKTVDLMKQISQVLNDGYHFVDVYELEDENETPISLNFEVQTLDDFIDYKVDALSDDTVKSTISTSDPIFAFSLEDISKLHLSVMNALDYYKECRNSSSYSREEKDALKSMSIDARNMEAKLVRILKAYQQ